MRNQTETPQPSANGGSHPFSDIGGPGTGFGSLNRESVQELWQPPAWLGSGGGRMPLRGLGLVILLGLGLWSVPLVQGGVTGVGPINSMTATGNAGLITSINGIPVSELVLGVTSFEKPPTYPGSPPEHADNFDLSLVASADDQPVFVTYFGQPVTMIFLMESGANDRGFVQGVDAAGNPVGDFFGFTTNTYLRTEYRTGLNQVVGGLAVWTDQPVFGVRVRPFPGETLGFDPVSVSGFAHEPAAPGGDLKALPGFSEVWNGEELEWGKALYTEVDFPHQSRVGIPFGLALPTGYTLGAGEKYPWVVYLHGTAARGINDSRNLVRQTARFFVHLGRIAPDFNAFVLSPQVPDGQRFVDVSIDHGPYEQSASTLTLSMRLTESLIRYLVDSAHDDVLRATLGYSAGEVDERRIYVVGDSLGAYGAWDTVGRGAIGYAAAMAAAGSGPANRLDRIRATPFWAIHGVADLVVPNYLPHSGDEDGAGSLGMLGLIDPTFLNVGSTDLIRLDRYLIMADDPTPADTLVYTEYPSFFDHNTVSVGWTESLSSDFPSWLFAHRSPEPPPLVQLVRNPEDGEYYLVWPGVDWVLQESADLHAEWLDVDPPAASPHPVSTEGDQQFFRFRAADRE